METKQDQALYELLSQRPDTKQQAITGISACSRVISVFTYSSAECQLLNAGFWVDPLGGVSVVGRDVFESPGSSEVLPGFMSVHLS
jgi:hypothetical protein